MKTSQAMLHREIIDTLFWESYELQVELLSATASRSCSDYRALHFSNEKDTLESSACRSLYSAFILLSVLPLVLIFQDALHTDLVITTWIQKHRIWHIVQHTSWKIRGSNLGTDDTFPHFQNVHTSSAVLPASYSMDITNVCRGKAAGQWCWPLSFIEGRD